MTTTSGNPSGTAPSPAQGAAGAAGPQHDAKADTANKTADAAAGTDGAAAGNGELDALKAQVAELEGKWKLAVADLDNHRKRTAREAAGALNRERARVASAWLPVLDNLESALEHASADPKAIVEGVRAVREQAVGVLAGLGFPRHADEEGKPFDPAKHEAVSTIASPQHEGGTIVHTVRPGYGEGDNVLRPAAVVVATKSE